MARKTSSDHLRDSSRLDWSTEKIRDIPEWKNDPKPYTKFPAPGKITSAETHLLYKIPFWLGPGHYADVGVYKGRSTSAIGHGMTDAGAGGTLYSVDYFGTEPEGQEVFSDKTAPGKIASYFIENELIPFLYICTGNSAYWGNKLKKDIYNINFVFLDADHSYESTKADFNAWSPLIRRGGMLAFHDCNFHGVHKVIQEMPDNWELIRQIFSIKLFKKG